MAKRRRLGPAQALDITPLLQEETRSGRPPIAQVAGDIAGQAALDTVVKTLEEARSEGRLIQRLPLARIETGHLVRDRMALDEDEMVVLVASLRARGQQTPIEVVALDDGSYGLISGLRRVEALRRIGAESVLALIRTPETSADAYVAMVEENEIRAGLSFYERARLAAEAAELGLYKDARAAVKALFSSASPAKRSKIGSFVAVHMRLGDVLVFPTAIPERLGLALAAALDGDPGFEARVREALDRRSSRDAAAERTLLEAALKPPRKATDPADRPRNWTIAPGLTLEHRAGRLTLKGAAVTEEMGSWLAERLRERAG